MMNISSAVPTPAITMRIGSRTSSSVSRRAWLSMRRASKNRCSGRARVGAVASGGPACAADGGSAGDGPAAAASTASSSHATNASSSELAPRAATRAAGESLTSTRPACISEMRSQRSASFMKCVETKIVTPSRRDRSTSACQNASRATGSTPDVGSSRISISGR